MHCLRAAFQRRIASNGFARLFQTIASDYSERFVHTAARLLGFESRCTAVVLLLMLLLWLLLFAAAATIFDVLQWLLLMLYVHNFACVLPHSCIPDRAAKHVCWTRRILRDRVLLLVFWGVGAEHLELYFSLTE